MSFPPRVLKPAVPVEVFSERSVSRWLWPAEARGAGAGGVLVGPAGGVTRGKTETPSQRAVLTLPDCVSGAGVVVLAEPGSAAVGSAGASSGTEVGASRCECGQ